MWLRMISYLIPRHSVNWTVIDSNWFSYMKMHFRPLLNLKQCLRPADFFFSFLFCCPLRREKIDPLSYFPSFVVFLSHLWHCYKWTIVIPHRIRINHFCISSFAKGEKSERCVVSLTDWEWNWKQMKWKQFTFDLRNGFAYFSDTCTAWSQQFDHFLQFFLFFYVFFSIWRFYFVYDRCAMAVGQFSLFSFHVFFWCVQSNSGSAFNQSN